MPWLAQPRASGEPAPDELDAVQKAAELIETIAETYGASFLQARNTFSRGNPL